MSQFPKKLLTLSLLLLPFLSRAQTLSASKLSAHLINDYTVGSSNIVAGKPRVLKLLAADTYWPAGMLDAMRDFKTKTPNGVVVVRVYSPQMYDMSSNAIVAAGHFWTNSLKSSLDSISPADSALIDYLEGPNEGQTPTLGYPWDMRVQAAQWLNQFWTNLTPRIASAGYKPLIGSIAVGNPGGNPSDWQPLFTEFVPALRQAKAAGGGWSYHSYTLDYGTDLNVEINTSLRYRQYYSFFAAQFPDLAHIPLILTEGGVDQVGDRLTSGWQARGSAANYQRWLNWFDHQMQQDSYLLGCTLFQNGDPWWASFDLEQIMPGAAAGVVPIADWFGNYLKTPTNLPPVPTGLAATTGTASVTLTWTHTPLHPTTFNVKRSKTNGGPYTIVATNMVNGINAATFADNSVTNGGTYYYVVSAVNAFGESANSTQITAAIAALPDVTITSLSTTNLNPIYTGNPVVFRAVVKNQGGAATPTGPNKGIGIGFSLGPFFCYRGADENLSLAPGASQLFTANGPGGAFTWTAALGTHSLSATVDDINRFPEVDENNNTSLTNLDVGIRINSGGATTTSSFIADTNFSGGTTFLTTAPGVDTSLVSGVAAPAAVYFSERNGNFSYLLTNLTPNKVYALRLHFMELSFTNAGQRAFNVSINGSQVLTNFDIWAETGARFKAIAKRFHVAADGSGQISLQFTSVTGQAKLSGLDLIMTNAMPNALPIFLSSSNYIINANSTLTFTAKAVDADQPFQNLTFGFCPTAVPPAGTSINLTNGSFTWTPTIEQAGTNLISLRVLDGVASSCSTFFQVIVVAPPRFSQITNAPDGTLTLNISAFAGKTYRVEYKNNLEDANWLPLGNDIVAGSNTIFVNDSTIGNAHRFYRVLQLD